VKGSRKNLIFVVALGAFLLTNFIQYTRPEKNPQGLSSEDHLFIEAILSSLKSMTGEFERTTGPLVQTGSGFTQVDIDRFSGDQSVFIRLGDIVDRHPSVAHQVISTLVGCLDDTTPTMVTYRGKNVPLGIMCYEALNSICYYEATDKNGNITAWEGTVLPGATKADLKTAKRAWKTILKKRTYIML